jgi:T5SS/PEP-CTERM-associated repeat protein/autotransporter-associated beta strand protein
LEIAGGVAVNGTGRIGYEAGSSGAATVTGASSTWTNSSGLNIGEYGNGTLDITDGGVVVSGSLDSSNIGLRTGSIGAATVSGTGSKWTNNGNLVVGFAGKGTVTQTGGTISVGRILYLGYSTTGDGTFNLNGGTLILKALAKLSGTAAFNFGGGTLQASGAFSSSLPMTLTGTDGNANFNTDSYTVTLSGVLTGTGGLNKMGSGTLILSVIPSYEGDTSVNEGTLNVPSLNNPLADVAVYNGAKLITSSITANSLTIGGTPPLGEGTSSAGCVDSVPEPSTLTLFCIAALGLTAKTWRRLKFKT